METLANLLARPAPVAGRAALLFEDNVYTYAELEALSNQVAQALIAQGVRPGNVVCQVLRSRPELVVNLFGILKSGVIYAPLNPSLIERELAEQLADCRPSIIIADEELCEQTIEPIAAGLPGCRVWSAGALAAYSRQMPASPPSRSIDPDGVGLLFYTSGTTGRAKGVQLSHRNVLVNARQVLDRTVLGPEDRPLVIMPIFHVNGLCNQVVVPFMAGASIVLRPRFVLEEFWPSVARYRPTYFTAVPTILGRLLEGPAPDIDIDIGRNAKERSRENRKARTEIKINGRRGSLVARWQFLADVMSALGHSLQSHSRSVSKNVRCASNGDHCTPSRSKIHTTYKLRPNMRRLRRP